MTYEAFRSAIRGYPLVSWPIIKMLMPVKQQLRIQISRWKKKGKLIALNRRFLIMNEADRKINPSRLYMACEIYQPSYVSLEYALSFHGLIPEQVADMTCVTTKKTKNFTNPYGSFVYRHIKTRCFSGFSTRKDEAGLSYYMAEPEKALADFIYLNLEKFKPREGSHTLLTDSYRLQNMEILDKKKLLRYADLFGSKKLLKVVKVIRL